MIENPTHGWWFLRLSKVLDSKAAGDSIPVEALVPTDRGSRYFLSALSIVLMISSALDGLTR